MRKLYLIFIMLSLLFIEVKGQQNKFLIGMYDMDYSGNDASPAGTVLYEGNDFAFLNLLAQQNFNFVQIEYQLTRPYTSISKNLPSKQFLDNAYALNLKVILNSPEVSINRPNNPAYKFFNIQGGLNYWGNHPAMMGFNIIDEPGDVHFPYIKSYADTIRNYNPNLLRMANLLPPIASDQLLHYGAVINTISPLPPLTFNARNNEDVGYANYIQNYIDQTSPNMLSYDFYPLWSHEPDFFYSLDVWGRISTKNNLPYMYVLTPIKIYAANTSPCPGPTYGATYSIPEFNYMIFGAMAYGAKGLSYWHSGDGNCGRTWFEAIPTNTMTYLTNLHRKIIDNGDQLLNLRFRSAYHYNTIPTVTTAYANESIPTRSLWSNLPHDEYAKRILDSIPFTAAAGSSIDNLAVTFHTDAAGNVYFWVLNKNITNAMDLYANLKSPYPLVNILNNTKSASSILQAIHLEPGEGKVFGLACPSDYDRTESMAYMGDNLVQVQHDITSYIDIPKGYHIDYIAGNSVHLTPGFNFSSAPKLGRNGIFNASIVGCYLPSTNPSNSSTNKIATTWNANDDNKNLTYVYPNPSNGSFRINLNSTENAEVHVFNDTGREVYSKKIDDASFAELNLSDQAEGIYLIKINTGMKIISEKIVIMK